MDAVDARGPTDECTSVRLSRELDSQYVFACSNSLSPAVSRLLSLHRSVEATSQASHRDVSSSSCSGFIATSCEEKANVDFLLSRSPVSLAAQESSSVEVTDEKLDGFVACTLDWSATCAHLHRCVAVAAAELEGACAAVRDIALSLHSAVSRYRRESALFSRYLYSARRCLSDSRVPLEHEILQAFALSDCPIPLPTSSSSPLLSRCPERLAEPLPLDPPFSSAVAFAALASHLERLLVQIFWASAVRPDNKKTCPSMVKDLLASEELTTELGSDIISIMQALVGPPTGINLRNVLWSARSCIFLLSYGRVLISCFLS